MYQVSNAGDQDNVKMGVGEITLEDVNWTELAQHRLLW
jgi:hypothetical protein